MRIQQGRLVAIALAVGAGLLVLAWLAWLLGSPQTGPRKIASGADAPSSAARFVGSQVCVGCHQAQGQAWQGSHHDLAMQHATPATVLAPFRGEAFTEAGITSRFRQRDGKFYIETQDRDGREQEFEVTHTLGVYPLQQFLVPMPDKGMQALTMAWDARPQGKGGQRWFDLHAGQNVKPGDPLHWTGRQNNWNFMCAECHTTNFKKNFDVVTRTYGSTWSEGNVGCESCHGPGSRHVAWSGLSGAARLSDATMGLAQLLRDRKDAQWNISAETGNAVRSPAVSPDRAEVQLCAQCHSHRSQISDNYVHGKPLLDTHVPSLLDKSLFWPDGQMKAEVYNYASFQQSLMYQKGVSCSDCHNPHSLQLRAPGNAVCFQCHAPAKYEAQTHTFHELNSKGSSCVACHMPTTTYMSIDPRHDHGIRVPRPDLSVGTGIPNACNKCHVDKSPEWASQALLRWYPGIEARHPPLQTAFAAFDKGDEKALSLLSKVFEDAGQSSIARASALSRAVPAMGPEGLNQIGKLLQDRDPLVRRTAVEALATAPPEIRSQWLRPMLADPVKAVRMSVARWLAGVPVAGWDAKDQAQLSAIVDEYVKVQLFNADRPESYDNLGTLYADQGKWKEAEAALNKAIELAPDMAASSLNLADVYRAQGREDDAQSLLRDVAAKFPGDATAQHALGLSLLRQRRLDQALVLLRRSAELAPDNARFAYVYALALERDGQDRLALATLENALKLSPMDQDAAAAAAAICKRSGDAFCRK